MMEILPKKPQALQTRFLPDSIAIKCDCKSQFLWKKRAGNKVMCPNCGETAELKIDEATVAPEDVKDPHNA